MSKLALLGGEKVRTTPFPVYRTIGEEEKRAVIEVMDSGVLSKFLGTWSPDFYGGPRVQKLEKEWAAYFGMKHAVSVNSATSALYAAVGAAGVGPGDEVIVSPYTMVASATAALVYGGIPVFADIDPDTFCMDPKSIRERVSPRTKAIIAVDIFGHPAAFDEIMAIAREHNLVVIEDTAQAPGATYKGRWAGTLGHMGIFSLNYHKTIHSGEGGIIVTDDDYFAERLQLIRNHAEVVVDKKGVTELSNMIGFNYRMTELEAAIASEQLKKLESLVTPRVAHANYLTERLKDIPGITPPAVMPDVRHGYYVYSIKYDAGESGVHRDRIVEALRAEGIPCGAGYVRPIYLEPMYQKRIGFGSSGYPFTLADKSVSYERGICPVCEQMHFEQLISFDACHANLTEADLDDFVRGIEKVIENREQLR